MTFSSETVFESDIFDKLRTFGYDRNFALWDSERNKVEFCQ